MKRKRSDGGVRVWWDSTDVRKIFIDQHLLWVFPLKTARLFNKKGGQSTPDLSFLASSEGRLAGGGA